MSDNIVIFRIYNNLQHNIRTKGKNNLYGHFLQRTYKITNKHEKRSNH